MKEKIIILRCIAVISICGIVLYSGITRLNNLSMNNFNKDKYTENNSRKDKNEEDTKLAKDVVDYINKNVNSNNNKKDVNEEVSKVEATKEVLHQESNISNTTNIDNKNAINTSIKEDKNKESSTEPENKVSSSNKENEVINASVKSEVNTVMPETPKAKINAKEYLLKQPYISHTLKVGETLSTIARNYESNCNPNSTIKMINTINQFNNPDDLEINTIIKIPESTIKNGTMYKVVSGDTWFKLSEKFYPNYDSDSIMNLVVFINNFPNNDLPLGENIFLPKIS